MLHKRHNSVVTLAMILALVGVSKPAKAFLLAQSDTAPATFNVPDRLSEDAAVKIAASNSTDSISASLKDSFTVKYPQAKVDIETQDSGAALTSVSKGQADLAAIGRNLTEAEQERGFVAVPVSREKIAVVVSKENPYDGNLTIDQFAQIFRGEITDWSEIGGAPGAIELVDLPDSNDTRQAFPNYPVFQSAEFATGNNATQLEQDSTEATVEQLGKNAISYAVANDVVNRDDVKIVTMHSTQPDDSRYPFSQPFNLVYQGTPSQAAQAYVGFATAEGGQEVVTSRIGSISTAAPGAIASGAAVRANNGAAPSVETDVDGQTDTVSPDAENLGSTDVDGVDPNAVANADLDADGVDPNAVADTDLDADGVDPNAVADTDLDADGVDPNAVADTDLDGSEAVNPDIDGSGEVNPDIDGSGEINPDIDGSGAVNPDIDGSGEVNPDIDGSGEVNPDIDGSGEPLSSETVDEVDGEVVVPEGAEETVATRNGNKWWLLLIPLLAIPLLGAMIFGGRKKSDREPAVDNVPNVSSPDGGDRVSRTPNDGGVPPVGANVSGNLGNVNVAENTVNNSSRMGSAGLAAGGAALAGGAAAANLARRNRRTENVSDADLDLDLDLDESATANEIPSNPVTEFTGQETKLQVGPEAELETDRDIDLDLDSSDSGLDGISSRDAAFGGATGLGRNLENDLVDESVVESSNSVGADSDFNNVNNGLNTPDTNAGVGREFPGDYVLPEETTDISVSDADIDRDPSVNGGTGIINGATAAGGAALGGAAAAASGMFNRGQDAVTDAETEIDSPSLERDNDLDLDSDSDRTNETLTDFPRGVDEINTPNLEGVDVADSNQDTDLNIGSQTTTPELDLSTDIDRDPNFDNGTGIINGATAAGGAALGGAAAAASGMFNRGQDAVTDAETEIDSPSLERDDDLDLDLDSDRTNESANFIGEVSEVDVADSNQDTDLNIGSQTTTPELDLSTDIDRDPNFDSGTGIINGATAAGGAVLGGAAAAASGMFNRGDAVTDAETEINSLSLERDDDLDLSDRTNESANFIGEVSEVDVADSNQDTDLNVSSEATTPELERDDDLDLDLDLNERNTDSDFDFDFDLSDRTSESANFAGGVSEVDAPNLERIDVTESNQDTDLSIDSGTTTPELDLSTDTDRDPNVDGGTGIPGSAALGGAAASGFINREDNTSDIQEFETFETSFDVSADTNSSSFADNVIADAETLSIDDNDNDLQGMTLDSIDSADDLDLDELTLDNDERTINASLENITFDNVGSSSDIHLDGISLNDVELDSETPSTNDVMPMGSIEDIRLEDLGFADTETNIDLDSSDSRTVDTNIDDLSDNRSDDMNNISEWLDSLETPKKDGDNISSWLDTLDSDSVDLNAEPNNSNPDTDLAEEADDISFQFLEDLLDRDADRDRNNQ